MLDLDCFLFEDFASNLNRSDDFVEFITCVGFVVVVLVVVVVKAFQVDLLGWMVIKVNYSILTCEVLSGLTGTSCINHRGSFLFPHCFRTTVINKTKKPPEIFIIRPKKISVI